MSKRVILDTDMGPDIDDAAALGMLHVMVDKGEVEILGVMSCNLHPMSAPVCDIINTYYGRPEIPIGNAKKGKDVRFLNHINWWEDLVDKYPYNLKCGRDAPDAVALYRQLLARQTDQSVTVVAIGQLTNLGGLVETQADAYCEWNGIDLVRRKVTELVVMGGAYPSGPTEWNFMTDVPAAKGVTTQWPTPIMFSGFEIGNGIGTGARLRQVGPENSPVRRCYEYCLSRIGDQTRPSWDQTAVLYAVRGLGDYWTAQEKGTNSVNEDGSNYWKKETGGRHRYLKPKMESSKLANIIEDMMIELPRMCPIPVDAKR